MCTLLPIIFAVFISAIGYGISFPLIGLHVEQTGASGAMIGLNAAMPALGWIVGEALVPLLQLRLRIGIAALAVGFLLCAAAAIAGMRYAEGFLEITVLRFFFGGGIGMFYRSVEYWINALSADRVRARNLSINGVAFMLGLVIGSATQPALGKGDWMAFGPILALILAASLSTALWPRLALPPRSLRAFSLASSCIAALPIAFVAVFCYGLYESVPAYLTQIYALRNGLSSDIAAYTLTAAALGNILVPIPMGILSDRIGRTTPLLSCSMIAAAACFIIPSTLSNTGYFLITVLVAAGAAGGVYGLGLAVIGDRFKNGDLVVANAAFGLVYATASVIGPMINGLTIDTLHSHGLMLISGAIFTIFSLVLLVWRTSAGSGHSVGIAPR